MQLHDCLVGESAWGGRFLLKSIHSKPPVLNGKLIQNGGWVQSILLLSQLCQMVTLCPHQKLWTIDAEHVVKCSLNKKKRKKKKPFRAYCWKPARIFLSDICRSWWNNIQFHTDFPLFSLSHRKQESDFTCQQDLETIFFPPLNIQTPV